MHKIIAIVGPTATGKTARAVEEAQKTPSIIVSADSRQCYRGMDIVTGKDHPTGQIIYGLDIVNPDEPCSVAVWYDAVMPHITTAWQEGKQVIVVGGTGLYVKAILGGITTMTIPPNEALRLDLSPLSLAKLQAKLQAINPDKFAAMNHSDQHNPRRLIRAIEVAMYPNQLESRFMIHESRIIGLKYSDLSIQQNKIQERVMSRIKSGAIEETKNLLAKYDRELQSMSAIGYRSIIKHLDGLYTPQEMIDAWVSDELNYAKRQLTWFRKQPIIWYDVDVNKV